ncbi:MAG TPA: hypothetical protein VEY30_04665, partial [Myxococcaceae bacterium]|nr:hypothetical protein [Myxococcaceae bacterium]
MRLGQILTKSGLVSADGLERALQEQRSSGGKLGQVLVRLGLAKESDVTAALARQSDLAVVDLEAVVSSPEALSRLSAGVARALRVLPLALRDGG